MGCVSSVHAQAADLDRRLVQEGKLKISPEGQLSRRSSIASRSSRSKRGPRSERDSRSVRDSRSEPSPPPPSPPPPSTPPTPPTTPRRTRALPRPSAPQGATLTPPAPARQSGAHEQNGAAAAVLPPRWQSQTPRGRSPPWRGRAQRPHRRRAAWNCALSPTLMVRAACPTPSQRGRQIARRRLPWRAGGCAWRRPSRPRRSCRQPGARTRDWARRSPSRERAARGPPSTPRPTAPSPPRPSSSTSRRAPCPPRAPSCRRRHPTCAPASTRACTPRAPSSAGRTCAR
mmetsp:Transcript_10115/g.33420  ORF Transcript_10115/g.33420 Transcript_10115/m.33420 type:complete len:287 (-) Transcript_10115:1495-2355(-)